MSFPTPDGACISLWGLPAVHVTDAGNTDVLLVEAEGIEAAPHVLKVMFGTIAASGFATAPVKNDTIEFDGVAYRVYDVKSDRPGGTRDTDGFWIHLVNAE